MPQGYGFKVGGDATWGLNYMIHSLDCLRAAAGLHHLGDRLGPGDQPGAHRHHRDPIHWLDVAGAPQLYPVFDAERGFDTNGDGQYTFPDEVPTDPAAPGYEEREKISNPRTWTLPRRPRRSSSAPATCTRAARTSTSRSRATAPTPGSIDGDDPSEVRPLFRSDAHYYEPAGRGQLGRRDEGDAARLADQPQGRRHRLGQRHLRRQQGLLVRVDGDPAARLRTADDPAAKDPFDDEAAVEAMYDEGGILTHGRLPENIDAKARKNLKLPDPRELRSEGPAGAEGRDRDRGFRYSARRLLGQSRASRPG